MKYLLLFFILLLTFNSHFVLNLKKESLASRNTLKLKNIFNKIGMIQYKEFCKNNNLKCSFKSSDDFNAFKSFLEHKLGLAKNKFKPESNINPQNHKNLLEISSNNSNTDSKLSKISKHKKTSFPTTDYNELSKLSSITLQRTDDKEDSYKEDGAFTKDTNRNNKRSNENDNEKETDQYTNRKLSNRKGLANSNENLNEISDQNEIKSLSSRRSQSQSHNFKDSEELEHNESKKLGKRSQNNQNESKRVNSSTYNEILKDENESRKMDLLKSNRVDNNMKSDSPSEIDQKENKNLDSLKLNTKVVSNSSSSSNSNSSEIDSVENKKLEKLNHSKTVNTNDKNKEDDVNESKKLQKILRVESTENKKSNDNSNRSDVESNESRKLIDIKSTISQNKNKAELTENDSNEMKKLEQINLDVKTKLNDNSNPSKVSNNSEVEVNEGKKLDLLKPTKTTGSTVESSEVEVNETKKLDLLKPSKTNQSEVEVNESKKLDILKPKKSPTMSKRMGQSSSKQSSNKSDEELQESKKLENIKVSKKNSSSSSEAEAEAELSEGKKLETIKHKKSSDSSDNKEKEHNEGKKLEKIKHKESPTMSKRIDQSASASASASQKSNLSEKEHNESKKLSIIKPKIIKEKEHTEITNLPIIKPKKIPEIEHNEIHKLEKINSNNKKDKSGKSDKENSEIKALSRLSNNSTEIEKFEISKLKSVNNFHREQEHIKPLINEFSKNSNSTQESRTLPPIIKNKLQNQEQNYLHPLNTSRVVNKKVESKEKEIYFNLIATPQTFKKNNCTKITYVESLVLKKLIDKDLLLPADVQKTSSLNNFKNNLMKSVKNSNQLFQTNSLTSKLSLIVTLINQTLNNKVFHTKNINELSQFIANKFNLILKLKKDKYSKFGKPYLTKDDVHSIKILLGKRLKKIYDKCGKERDPKVLKSLVDNVYNVLNTKKPTKDENDLELITDLKKYVEDKYTDNKKLLDIKEHINNALMLKTIDKELYEIFNCPNKNLTLVLNEMKSIHINSLRELFDSIVEGYNSIQGNQRKVIKDNKILTVDGNIYAKLICEEWELDGGIKYSNLIGLKNSISNLKINNFKKGLNKIHEELSKLSPLLKNKCNGSEQLLDYLDENVSNIRENYHKMKLVQIEVYKKNALSSLKSASLSEAGTQIGKIFGMLKLI